MDCKSFLKDVYLFKDLTDSEIESICSIAETQNLNKGEQLFEEGSVGEEFFIVTEGSIAIYKNVAGGRKRNLTNLDKRKIVGELALFDNQPRSAHAEAAEQTTILNFNIKKFQEILKTSPSLTAKFQHQIILTLCSRLRDANEKLNQGVIWGFKAQI